MEVALKFFLIAFLLVVSSQGAYTADKPRSKCIITRTHKMLAADCHGNNLDAIPQDLQTDIEILAVSYNRLRKLTADSFSMYTQLKMLYLEDNLIGHVAEGTFSPLTKLEVINLSLNGLNTIPEDLLRLPNLRRIYIDHNTIDDTSFDKIKGIVFPVAHLSMSHCGLTKLPSLQVFPGLIFLNVSYNQLSEIEPHLLSYACGLEEIDLNGNLKMFRNNLCECQALEHYLSVKNIRLTPPFALNCSQIKFPHESECGNLTLPLETEDVFNDCIAYRESRIKAAAMQKVYIGVGVSLLCLIVIAVLVIVCVHRRCKRKQKERENNVRKGESNEEPASSLLEPNFNVPP